MAEVTLPVSVGTAIFSVDGGGATGNPYVPNHSIEDAPFAGAAGAAVPTTTVAVGGTDATLLRIIKTLANGTLVCQLVAGTAAIGDVNVLTMPTGLDIGTLPPVDIANTYFADSGFYLGDPTTLLTPSTTINATPVFITAAPTSGQKRKVTEIYISSDQNQLVSLNWEGTGNFFAVYVAANQLVTIVPREPFLGPAGTGANARLRLTSSIDSTNATQITTRSYSVA